MPKKPPAPGRVLMHDHIMHEPDTPLGLNGFRAWTANEVLPNFVALPLRLGCKSGTALATNRAQPDRRVRQAICSVMAGISALWGARRLLFRLIGVDSRRRARTACTDLAVHRPPRKLGRPRSFKALAVALAL